MFFLLTLACAIDCRPGYVEVDKQCVPYSRSDTTEPTPTDTATDTGTPTDPDASPGHYTCETGFGHAFDGPALRGLCGVCDSLNCTWTVYAVDDAGEVGFVEMDLYDAPRQGWREYHDAFSLLRRDADGADFAIELAQILEPDDYESNSTTWVDPRNPETLAGLSAQANAFMADGTFLDCFTWGPDAATVFGDACSVVE